MGRTRSEVILIRPCLVLDGPGSELLQAFDSYQGVGAALLVILHNRFELPRRLSSRTSRVRVA
jgi:hypothetical protein